MEKKNVSVYISESERQRLEELANGRPAAAVVRYLIDASEPNPQCDVPGTRFCVSLDQERIEKLDQLRRFKEECPTHVVARLIGEGATLPCKCGLGEDSPPFNHNRNCPAHYRGIIRAVAEMKSA